MTLPAYLSWQAAIPVLHQAAQILNAARLASLDPLPNALRHSLRPIPNGATTDALKEHIVLTLDYPQGTILVAQEDGAEILRVNLNAHTQDSLSKTVFSGLAQAGYDLKPNSSKLTGANRFDLDLTQGQIYADVQWRMFQTLAALKASMYGPQNPLVLWPHGFDLSTLWFVEGMDEGRDPHLNFGFSPGTPDIGQPYVYFYAVPALNDLRDQIPDLFTWATGWHSPGGYIPYDRFANESLPEQLLLDALLDVYRMASARLMAA
ncbi:MAG: DUF5996 family protein [Anaerolineae bacterium]|nr:DUF5996 family protein [Anaerolineae bacterium]